MVSLLGVGCSAFLAVGLVDQRACDTLKAQEASLDLLTWLKLLFVPTLAIVILILFLLEEYCYAHEQDANHTHNHNHTMPHGQQALHAHAHSSPSSSGSGPSKALLPGGSVGTGGGGTGGELQGAASSLLRKASGGRGDASALVSQEKRLRSPSGAAGSGATATAHQAAMTAAGGDAQPFPHPLTLLSPSRTTPDPSPAYPHLTLASGAADGSQLQGDALSAAAQYVGFNPQAILAGEERAVRQQVIQQGMHQAQQAQIALMGHPASLAMTAAQQPGAFRINLMNEAGVSCILVVHATTTLREVFAWYAAKNNAACWINSSNASSSSSSSSSAAASGTAPSMHHSLYRFRLQGTLLTNEKATLGSLGLPYAPTAAAAAATPPKDTSVAVKEKAKDKAATAAAAKEKAASTTAMTPASSTATAASTAAGSDASSPSSSSAKDCCLIQVELDWERLYHQLQHETLKDAEHLVELKAIELEALAGEQEKTRSLEEKVSDEKKRSAEVHHLLEAAATAKVEHQAKIDAAKIALSSETTRVLSARKDKLEAEGSDTERVEFKRLDKTVQALKRELEALHAEVTEINGKRTRLENERAQLTRETTIVREKTSGMEEEEVKLAMYAVNEDGTPATTTTTTATSSTSAIPLPSDFLPLSSLNSSLEALERTFEDLKLQRKKVDFITQEIAHKKAEVHALAKKVHMSAGLTATAANNTTGEDMGAGGAAGMAVGGSMPPVPLSGGGGGGGSKLDALPHLRSRAAQLEAQTKDLLRWKSVAKHLELEAKEAFRWQSLLRAAVQRERANASPTATTTTASSAASTATAAATIPSNGPSAEQIAISTWRARARAFSREATALRAHKRSILAGGGGSGGADGGSGAQGGDFYSSASEAAAADAGFGLGMNAKWEAMDGGNGDLSSSMLLHAQEEEDAEPEDPSLRIEPLPMHARAAEAEEAERQAALLQSGATSTASSAAASTASTAAAAAEIMGGPSDRLSEELLAAEQEEERLLASMASHRGHDGDQTSAGGSGPASPSRRASSPSSAAGGASGSAAQGGVDSSAAAEEELFRLGEALVRRNQHLHQHRLMVRYQQQQQHQQHQQASLQQQQGGGGGMRVSDGSMDFLPGTTNSGSGQSSMQQQYASSSASSGSMLMQQQSSSSSSEPQQHSYSNAKASLTGILQATAPVFTPRYQTDAPSVMPLGGQSPVRQSHYTRVTSGGGGGGGGGGLATSPQLAALTATTSPSSNSTLSWSPAHAHNQSDNFPTSSGTSSMSGSHHGPSSLEASWNSSLQSLLDDMDSSAGHHHPMSSLTSHSRSGVHRSSAMVGVGRDRSYSNPSAPNALPPLAAHHAPVAHQQQFGGLSSLSGGIGTSLNSGLSSGGLGSSLNAHDPFTAFRRQANPHGGGGLAIIDDADHATSFDHTNGFTDPLALGQPINLQQYHHPFSARGASTSSTTPLGSASLSRVHSGASSPSQQLFASSAAGGLPPFFALNNQK